MVLASLQDAFLGGWSLKRNIDGTEKSDYTLPHDFSIIAGQKIKVHCMGSIQTCAI